MSKYLLQCSCLICRKETTTQSLLSHIKSHLPKIHKNTCLQCGNPTNSKFCSQTCAATYNNARKDYTTIKTGPKKGTGAFTKICPVCWGFHPSRNCTSRQRKRKPPSDTRMSNIRIIKTTLCFICGTIHVKSGKTCSTSCKSKLLSLRMKSRIENGFNPNKNRGRHKRSYLETSFENWLIEYFPQIKFETEVPFKRLDISKTYFADFYFSELNLIIELDGTQHKLTKEYDNERDCYIKNQYNIDVIRITHSEYKNKSKLNEISEKFMSFLSESN